MSKSIHRPTERVTKVLETLFLSPDGLSLTDIAEKLSIPKGTLQPILKALENDEFVELDATTYLYKLGIKILILSRNVKENTNAIDLIKKEMRKIVDMTQEISQLAILMNNEVFYLEKITAPNQIQLLSHVGKKLPASCTAIGKALLSTKTPQEIKALFPDELPKLTEKSVSTLEQLLEECDHIRKTHFAEEFEESAHDISCIAVPLQAPNGKALAAISISYPLYRYSDEKRELIINLLLNAKKNLDSLIADLNITDLYS